MCSSSVSLIPYEQDFESCVEPPLWDSARFSLVSHAIQSLYEALGRIIFGFAVGYYQYTDNSILIQII